MPFVGGIGAPEVIIILVVLLIIFGVGRLPEVGGAMGKAIREFRSLADEKTDGDVETEKEEEKTTT